MRKALDVEEHEQLMQELFGMIEERLGPHVQCIMIFRDTEERVMWVASPFEAAQTRDLLERARENFSQVPVKSPYGEKS